MPASDEHLTRRLRMSDEYLTQRLTPYPLPTKDSGLLRTVGDARTYMLTLPKAASCGPTGSTPAGYSCKKPVRARQSVFPRYFPLARWP